MSRRVDKTVGHISATEYARLREAEAKVERVEALLADVHGRAIAAYNQHWFAASDIRAALVGDETTRSEATP